MISGLPSHKPLFCTFTVCKMRLPSNVTLLTRSWEPLCFSFSSQRVLLPEPLLKLRPGPLKLRRSSWPVCLRARSFGRDVVNVEIISLWKKSFKRAFAMLRQCFSGCFCDFNATISRSSTRKVPSRSSRIRSAVHILGKCCLQRR